MTTPRQHRESAELPKRRLSPVLRVSVAIFIAIVFVSVSLYFWNVASHGYKSLRLYAGHEIATGVVTKDIIEGQSTYYEFEINGKNYTGKTSDKIREGDVIDIAYLPSSPNINRPRNSLMGDTVTFGFVIAVFIIVFLLIINRRYLSGSQSNEK